MDPLAHLRQSHPVNVSRRDSDTFALDHPSINFLLPLESSSAATWLSSAILLLMSLIGLPLNATTVLIFWRRKKLRHLVNFVLILDCLSHILLCLVCVPIQVITAWIPPGETIGLGLLVLFVLQQVVGNFANLCGLFLTVSIGILRYRRLCWKKKDKFSTSNALKWSVTSGSLAIGFTALQMATSLLHQAPGPSVTLYSVKLSLILLSVVTIFFCYIRVAQRVWSSGTKEDKLMDASKLKKSRSIHLRATLHSCIQIILVVATLSPYLYHETMQVFNMQTESGEPSCRLYQDNSKPSRNQPRIPTLSLTDLRYETESSTTTKESGIHDDLTGSSGIWHSLFYFYCKSLPTSTDRLLVVTINYSLLILGTPLAYIASCHRYREQFKALLFFRGHSPPGSPAYRRHHHVRDGPGTPPMSRVHRVSSIHHLHSHSHLGRGKCFLHNHAGLSDCGLMDGPNLRYLSLSHPNLSSITIHPSVLGTTRKSSLIAYGESRVYSKKKPYRNLHMDDLSIPLHYEKNSLRASETERKTRLGQLEDGKKSSSSGSTSPLSLNSDHVLPEPNHMRAGKNSFAEFARCSPGSSFHSGSSGTNTTSISGNLTKEASISSNSGSSSTGLVHNSGSLYSNNVCSNAEPPMRFFYSSNQGLTRSRNLVDVQCPLYSAHSNFISTSHLLYGAQYGEAV